MGCGSSRRVEMHRQRRGRRATRMAAEGCSREEVAETLGARRAAVATPRARRHSEQRANLLADLQPAPGRPPRPITNAAGETAYLLCHRDVVLGRGWGQLEGDVLVILRADRLDDAFKPARICFNAATGEQLEARAIPITAICLSRAGLPLRQQLLVKNLVCLDPHAF